MRYTTIYKFSPFGNINLKIFDHDKLIVYDNCRLPAYVEKGLPHKHNSYPLKTFLYIFESSVAVSEQNTEKGFWYFTKASRTAPDVSFLLESYPEAFI